MKLSITSTSLDLKPNSVDWRNIAINGKLLDDSKIAQVKHFFNQDRDAYVYKANNQVPCTVFKFHRTNPQYYAVYESEEHKEALKNYLPENMKLVQNLDTLEWLVLKTDVIDYSKKNAQQKKLNLDREYKYLREIDSGADRIFLTKDGKKLDPSPLSGTEEQMMTIKLAPGLPLSKILNDRSNYSLTQRVSLITKIFMKVDELHKNNVVHTNIKPENIFYDASTGTVTLTGFTGLREKRKESKKSDDEKQELLSLGRIIQKILREVDHQVLSKSFDDQVKTHVTGMCNKNERQPDFEDSKHFFQDLFNELKKSVREYKNVAILDIDEWMEPSNSKEESKEKKRLLINGLKVADAVQLVSKRKKINVEVKQSCRLINEELKNAGVTQVNPKIIHNQRNRNASIEQVIAGIPALHPLQDEDLPSQYFFITNHPTKNQKKLEAAGVTHVLVSAVSEGGFKGLFEKYNSENFQNRIIAALNNEIALLNSKSRSLFVSPKTLRQKRIQLIQRFVSSLQGGRAKTEGDLREGLKGLAQNIIKESGIWSHVFYTDSLKTVQNLRKERNPLNLEFYKNPKINENKLFYKTKKIAAKIKTTVKKKLGFFKGNDVKIEKSQNKHPRPKGKKKNKL